MTQKTYQGKITTFWKLIKSHNIEIPIIQRDYAQGRIEKDEIRSNFLNALFNSLNESKSIRLDFIYGSIVNDSFQPLDGQQRLTTLYLLHWYAAIKEDIPREKFENILTKFKYETRISSREFCESLISNAIEINLDTTLLSSKITDSSWFFLSWKKDPTIDSMLRMIDDIHHKYFNVQDLWKKLTSEDCLIDFYHVDLEDIGLTDDLYIKMNARGKLLSSFENFKASFEKRISDEKWEENIEFKQSFANKIDSIWTDLFWLQRTTNNIDSFFIRFISTIAMIRTALEKSDSRTIRLRSIQEKPDSIKSYFFSEDSFKYLVNVFDIYVDLKSSIPEINFPLFQHQPDNSILSAIIKEGSNASYSQKVLFFAEIEFLLRHETFEDSKYLDWMRVIRNIISRGDVTKNGKRPAIIRSPETFEGVINLVNELAKGCNDIYLYLSENQVKSTFAREQIDEERLKASLIINNPDAKSVLHDTEDTNLLQGRIEFALHCIDHNFNSKSLEISKLRTIETVIREHFSVDTDINNDFRRAMLTIPDSNGNYEYYGYWWSFWNVVSANKRCLIEKYRELEYFIYGNYKGRELYRDYFKELVLKLRSSALKEISSNFDPPISMPTWKVKLIKETDWLDNQSKSNYIAIPEDETCCYLLKSMRPRDIEGCVKVE
ncbi:hypothetical protein GCM10009430_08810 [Aquimarina litoralis]|uniref:GmrSD restriction endonucleases N-terminal domain-containing protein n=1 Tax=Aquimarina litoralis TaxID=584605 RepID=A0ABN1IJ99_9FLAO